MKNKNKNILTDYQNNIINIPSTVLPCHLTKRSARANDFINFMNFTNFINLIISHPLPQVRLYHPERHIL